jgi:hypothetical protein
MEMDDRPESRSRFLRRLGTTLLVGLGVSLTAASTASAATTCCYSTCNPNCPSGTRAYWCAESSSCGCGGNGCCVCNPDVGSCKTVGCTCC